MDSGGRLPVFVMALLVPMAYVSTWGVILASLGFVAQRPGLAGAIALAKVIFLSISTLSLGASIVCVASQVRARRLPTTIAGQLMTGALLTVIVLVPAFNRGRLVDLQAAYSIMPSVVALCAFTQLSMVSAVTVLVLARRPSQGGDAALPISLVGVLVAVISLLYVGGPIVTLLAGGRIAGAVAWNAFQWCGSVALGLFLAQVAIAVGLWRRRSGRVTS